VGSWHEGYDEEQEDRKKSETDLDRWFAQREAELAEREQQLRERESEALKYLHNAEAKQAADAAKWRQVQLQITDEMRGEDIVKLYRQHGI
jgi:hypothetical protein